MDMARPRAPRARAGRATTAATARRARALARTGRASRRARGRATARVSGRWELAPIVGALGTITVPARSVWARRAVAQAEKEYAAKGGGKDWGKKGKAKARASLEKAKEREYMASMVRKTRGKETL